jgi:hypothetical protein
MLINHQDTVKNTQMRQRLRECRKNHLGGTKTGLDEMENPLSETPLSFCARNECADAHEAQRKRGSSGLFRHSLIGEDYCNHTAQHVICQRVAEVGCTHHLSGGTRQCRVGTQRCCAPPQGASHPCRQGRCRGSPLRTTLFSAFSLPCEIRPISQGRPCSASEHTRSVERKQGKGVVTGFPGGAPHSQESFCMTNHACTPEAGCLSRRFHSSRISAVLVAPTRVAPAARASNNWSSVRMPPAAFTCTCGGA